MGGDTLTLAKQSEQDVLGADIGMLQGFGLLAGEGEDLLHAGRVGDIAGHLVLLAGADLFLDLLADGLEVEAHLLEDIHRDPLAQLDQAEQEMLGADIVMVEAVGLLAGKGQNLLSAGREIVHHGCSPVAGLSLPKPLVGILPISGSGICFSFARIRAARKESRSSAPILAAWSPF